MKHWLIEATISELEAANIGTQHGNIGNQCSDTGAQCVVSTNIGVGTTMQMSNRVTNPWDMVIFSRPV